MNEGGETSFELVREAHGIVVYVSDHGNPLRVDGGLPELEIHRADGIQIIKGRAEGVSLIFPSIQDAAEAKMILKLKFPNGRVILGRFPLAATASLDSGGEGR